MYPELITRPDIKVFLPPIGNMTVYICASLSLCFFWYNGLTYLCSWKPGVHVR